MFFWDQIARESHSIARDDIVNPVINLSGKSAIDSALGRVRSESEPDKVALTLEELEKQFVIYSGSEEGQIILDSIDSGTIHPFALLMSILGKRSRLLKREQIPALRTNLIDLLFSSGAAYYLASASAEPKNRRREIAKIIASAKAHLDQSSEQQREIDGWFAAHRAQLDQEILEARKKISEIKEDADQSYRNSLEKMISNLESSLQKYRDELIDNIKDIRGNITILEQSTKNNLEKLENLYSSKLVLAGPSKLWRDVRDRARLLVIFSIILFSILLVAPAIYLTSNWPPISAFISDIVAHSSNGISLTGVAVISIPALGYGWLLRHISRIFIHNLNLMSDAEYREVLSTTFLGMAERTSTGITEAERALVLNALFRPAPPNTTEDGPPSGLIDLLGKKP